MNPQGSPPLVAVDIGNSRVKLGQFSATVAAAAGEHRLPEPDRTLDLAPATDSFDAIAQWLGPLPVTGVRWWIGSVQRSVASRLVEWLRGRGVNEITLLAAVDLPLGVLVPRPDMVGIDRLLGALAANRLRPEGAPAVVVDLGTAITVDLVSAEGAFLGGAIMPGIGMSARALHDFTDLLPLLDMQALADAPPALGTNTNDAMRAGIFWGAVGGARQLIELLSRSLNRPPHVLLTGGAAPSVATLVCDRAVYVPHLVLAGIALAAEASTDA